MDSDHKPLHSVTQPLTCMADDKKVYNDTCETVCLDGFQGRQDGRDIPGSTTYMCMFPNRTADAAKYHGGSYQDGVWKPAARVGARASLDVVPAPLVCGDVSVLAPAKKQMSVYKYQDGWNRCDSQKYNP